MATIYPTSSLPTKLTDRDGNPVNDFSIDPTSPELTEMMKFVRLCFDLTSDYLPDAAAIRRRAESWLKLLTPAFFQPEVDYVLQVCCRLRADRRDAIKADELLRIAEKVYGCSVNFWANPNAERDPHVWSVSAQEWMPLENALEALWRETYPLPDSQIEKLREQFKSVRPQLVEMIYGSN